MRPLPVLVFLAFSASALVPFVARAGCDKDTDCKGDRVCTNGVCVDPNGPAESAPPAVQAPQETAPTYQPPPPSYQPPPPTYQQAPPSYQPPPPPYQQPPPPPPPPPFYPRWRPPPVSGARSFAAIGGVGDILAAPLGGGSLGGLTGELQATFKVFSMPALDGGPTLNLLNDITFGSVKGSPGAAASIDTIGGGVGWDFGLFRFLQLGVRLNFGFLGDVSGFTNIQTGYVSFGGHAIAWLTRFFGLYFEVDGLYALPGGDALGARVAGGLAFSW